MAFGKSLTIFLIYFWYNHKIFINAIECLNNEHAFITSDGKLNCLTSCLCPPKVDSIIYKGCQRCCCAQNETSSLEKELKDENLHLSKQYGILILYI